MAHNPEFVAAIKALLELRMPCSAVAQLAHMSVRTLEGWKKGERFAHIEPDPTIRALVTDVVKNSRRRKGEVK